MAARNSYWWLRTPAATNNVWLVDHASGGGGIGQLHSFPQLYSSARGGVRPALIIHQ